MPPAAAITLRLPATSANLGPGFDTLGMALSLWLQIDAAPDAEFAIDATGRNADLVGRFEGNLMIETYRDFAPAAPPLHLTVRNQIPLGMGCGSSAAALLAGVVLGDHFGMLGLTPERLLAEACRREGHPDNVAACFHGGMTASAMVEGEVVSVTFGRGFDCRLFLVLPETGLATSEARALLPASYSRADAVENIQSTALLVAAAALNRPELLRAATRDRIHQPFRSAACPLLPWLAPMASSADDAGILAVTLSGAGPSVLVWASSTVPALTIVEQLRERLSTRIDLAASEIVEVTLADGYGLSGDGYRLPLQNE